MSSESKQIEKDSLISISRGAGFHIVGHAFQNGISFILQVLLTRTLGASLYGIFSFGIVILNIIYVISNLGSDKSLLKYIPEYRNQSEQNVFLTLAGITSIVSSILVAGLVFYLAPIISRLTLNSPYLVEVLQILALLIPFNTIGNLFHAALKGVEKKGIEVISASIFAPLSRVLLIGIALAAGFSIVGATAAYVVAGVIAFAFSLYLFKKHTDLGIDFNISKNNAVEYYNYTLPLTIDQMGGFLYNRIDILMVGYFLTSTTVGIYNIAVMLASVLTLALAAFNQLFPPLASKLHHSGNQAELSNVYSIVTRWVFSISLFPACVMIIFPKEILSVFGAEFVTGSTVLILFVFAQLFNSIAGPSGYMLMMTDHQYVSMFNQLGFGVANVLLNYILIKNIGFIGAAIATASVIAVANMAKVLEVWYFEGYFPYNKTYLGVLLGGLLAIGSMYGVSILISGLISVASGSILGLIIFVVCIYSFSITDDDKKLWQNITQ